MLLDRPIPIGYILNKVKFDIWAVIIVDLIVHTLTSRFEHLLPRLPIAIPTFLGTAISVLLSFKINQSYDRWWEARKVWGAIVNDSRTLVMQLKSFLKDKSHPVIPEVARRQIAWCYALAYSLRDLNSGEEVTKYISRAGMFDEIIIRLDEDLRGRKGDDIVELLKKGIADANNNIKVTVIPDESEAIRTAVANAKENSLIVIATEKVDHSIKEVKSLKEKADRERIK